MIKQNKGKDLHKVAKSKLVDGPYFISKKHDGHYVQIYFTDGIVSFFTSGGNEFYLDELAEFIKRHFEKDFMIECEYNYDCEGFLGDRGKSAILTTYRTQYQHGNYVAGDPKKDIFRILDAPHLSGTFTNRHLWIYRNFKLLIGWFDVPVQMEVPDLDTANTIAKAWFDKGYEGGMLKSPDHIYQPGKRTNDIIKLKPRPTADLLCIGWDYGKEGLQWEHGIGSLKLQDSEGRICNPGSGLDAWERDPELFDQRFKGKIIEIEYERIDQTYVQPIYKRIRDDKNESD